MAKIYASSNPEVSEREKGIWNAPEGLRDRRSVIAKIKYLSIEVGTD